MSDNWQENYVSTVASSSCCYHPEIMNENTCVRDEFGMPEFETQRPQYSLPKTHAGILKSCKWAYKQEGIVKHTIDLMSDFTVLGITLSHPNPNIQRFYRKWFENVKGADRSERFANNLYKFGVVVISKGTRVYARRTKQYTLPANYTFINPHRVVDIDGEEAIENGMPVQYGVLTKQAGDVSGLNWKREIKPLDPNKTQVFHYKKDDWEVWSSPIIYSILRDVYQLQMHRLADFTALEGAASPIRIFRLGNFEHRIVPTSAAFDKLRSLLQVNTGSGVREIVWGADIDIIESSASNANILGEDKYKPSLAAIYVGLGIPPTLTGSNVGGAGTTNNFMSLKTLVRRLEYGRQKLLEFWNAEIEEVRRIMGFRYPATVEFEYINMGDEEAEKRLFIELADRNLISDEMLQRKFGVVPQIEGSRINRDYNDRRKFKKAPKGGPWHDPQIIEKYEKMLMEAGKITPSQVGIVFPEPDGDEDFWDGDEEYEDPMDTPELDDILEDSPPEAETLNKPVGRPKNSRDKVKRKRRRFVPRTRAMLWAVRAQQQISDYLTPLALSHFGKKNMRQLSEQEAGVLETMKLNVLANTPLFSDITPEHIQNGVKNNKVEFKNYYNNVVRELEYNRGSDLSIDEKRRLQLEIYLDLNINED